MKRSILIVDDEKAIIQHVKTLLTSFGYQPDFISRPEFVINRLEHQRVSLILLDINMPGVDGITVLSQLKSNSRFSDIPVIMMTADTNMETLEKCFQKGAEDYITKPIQELVLKARVKSSLDRFVYMQQINSQMEEIRAQQEELMAQKEILEERNRLITESINYARRIQHNMFPSKDKLNSYLSEYFVLNMPRDIVSGDFYWLSHVQEPNSSKLFFIVADCTGHGVPAAFMTFIGASLLHEIIENRKIYEPTKILYALNRGINLLLKQEGDGSYYQEGMDLALCTFQKGNNGSYKVNYTGAKMPVFVYRADERKVEKYRTSGSSIGGEIIRPFEEIEFSLNKDDIIYMSSDGYRDQNDSNRQRLGSQRFLGLLEEIGELPLYQQKRMLIQSLREHMEGEDQRDDILIFGTKASVLLD